MISHYLNLIEILRRNILFMAQLNSRKYDQFEFSENWGDLEETCDLTLHLPRRSP